MRKLRIGYKGLSPDLKQPGDRRRVAFWAKHRSHQLITDLEEPVDVILLSERADFGQFPRRARGVPIIFDLIDGYLGPEKPSIDWFRGVAKVATGQLTGLPKPFTHYVRSLCRDAAAVICSSVEQKATISPYSKNIHVILDSHDEFPLIKYNGKAGTAREPHQILWEGMPVTLGGLEQVQPALTAVQSRVDLNINFVTDSTYFRLLGKYLKEETSILLESYLKELHVNTKIVPWSRENLLTTANNSDLAILPIKLDSPLQYLKPENRLLIMWRLGLPCLTSATPSYIRTAHDAKTDTVCFSNKEWEAKVQEFLQDEELAMHTVECGQAYLGIFHNTDSLLDKWDKAFESVL